MVFSQAGSKKRSLGTRHIRRVIRDFPWRKMQRGRLDAVALTDADDLSKAIYICHSEVGELGDPQPGDVDDHQDGAVFQVAVAPNTAATSAGLKSTGSFCSCRG